MKIIYSYLCVQLEEKYVFCIILLTIIHITFLTIVNPYKLLAIKNGLLSYLSSFSLITARSIMRTGYRVG